MCNTCEDQLQSATREYNELLEVYREDIADGSVRETTATRVNMLAHCLYANVGHHLLSFLTALAIERDAYDTANHMWSIPTILPDEALTRVAVIVNGRRAKNNDGTMIEVTPSMVNEILSGVIQLTAT